MANVLHSSLITTDLHEPKGVAAATSGQVYVANGAGSGVWTTPAEVVFPNKHIAGLTYQNAADATNDITVLAGTARDTTNTEDMTLSASITKRLDAAWTVGDNQGGLDAGSIANDTYHIWLIKRTDTDVVDVLFSTSATAPTMPADYTKKRRIGSFQRISGAIQGFAFVQETNGGGLLVQLSTVGATQTLALTNVQTSYVVSAIPDGIAFDGIFAVKNTNSGSTEDKFIGPVGLTSYTVIDGDLSQIRYTMTIRTDTSGQISADNITGGSDDIDINLLGWYDFRRD